ncbi:hypothetical protein J7L27_04940 [Candidatus Bathyarchaeota archaeon]|nr:hypothetical protein [Candidatus Bathyarchaeota archaeon]
MLFASDYWVATLDRLDIHGRQTRLELVVQSVRSSKLISERNKRLIF